MKSNLLKLAVILFALFALTQCETTDEPEPEVKDNALIVANSRVGKYVVVSPGTGNVLAEAQPAVHSVGRVRLGYMSKKTLLLSPPGPGTFADVIYSCDRLTGDNPVKITSEDDFDVMFFDVSPIGPQVVFAAQDINNLTSDNIHKINEDGSGYEQLSFLNEGIDCPDKSVSTKLVAAYKPCWSPDGSKIVFDGHLREIVSNNPHNSIILMDADGENKQVLYDVKMEETHYKDICWTQDSQFLVFLVAEGTEVKVKVLHVNSKSITDITSHLKVEGLHTENLWTSPTENKIYFNKYEPGGGDLYVIEYSVEADKFSINGSYRMLSEKTDSGPAFGSPDCQKWNGE